MNTPQHPSLTRADPTRVHFIANCMYGDHMAGGDLHFFQMARAADAAGYTVHFFGGHAFKGHWEKLKLPGTLTLTDTSKLPKIDEARLSGQFALLFDYLGRFWRTLWRLSEVNRQDCVYATTDYWFDVLPAILCKAANKMMVLHMECPTLRQILFKQRADVTGNRLASIYYWLSQNLSLRLFRRCRNKRVLLLHPLMEPRLLKLGYQPSELRLVSYGVDTAQADAVPEQKKTYDVAWIGRVHRQKGIDDLLQTLAHLAGRVEGFRAVLMGKVADELRPGVAALGIAGQVDLPGFVSEEEKVRRFKASRLFLMPSRHEGSPRVIAEALVCGVPVVAYDVANYRPLFGDFVRTVPAFDLAAFQAEAQTQVKLLRQGKNYLEKMDLAGFKRQNSWPVTQEVFVSALESF